MLVCISDVTTQYNVARIIRDSLSDGTGSLYSSETDRIQETQVFQMYSVQYKILLV